MTNRSWNIIFPRQEGNFFVCLNNENVTYILQNSKMKNCTLKTLPFLELAENIKYTPATEEGICSNI